MSTISTEEFRRHMAELISRVAFGGERVCISRHGKPVGAFISMEDLELLRSLEDRLDNEEAENRLAEGVAPMSWNEAKKQLES